MAGKVRIMMVVQGVVNDDVGRGGGDSQVKIKMLLSVMFNLYKILPTFESLL